MDEFALIERFFAQRAAGRDDVRIGIGDDGAVTSMEPGYELVVVTDTINEGVHFPAGSPPRSLGHRCLAVNLSDLAAMGAEPLWCTLALSLPEGAADWVDAFSDGFMALADEHDIALIGGDTVRGPLSMTVTAHGRVKSGSAIRRDGAGAGDAIFVTGSPGRARAGLGILMDAGASDAAAAKLVEAFRYPVPRVREGCDLRGVASAMIDVSDGLYSDLSRLLRASGVGATIDVDSVPLDEAIVERSGHARALEFALHGGDDYELCFTVAPERDADIARLSGHWNCAATRIGTTQPGDDIAWLGAGDVVLPDDAAFRHF